MLREIVEHCKYFLVSDLYNTKLFMIISVLSYKNVVFEPNCLEKAIELGSRGIV